MLHICCIVVTIFYDHALCLRQEIDLFWRAKFVLPTWIYLSNRYILLLYGISCLLQVPLWTTPLVCYVNSRCKTAQTDLNHP